MANEKKPEPIQQWREGSKLITSVTTDARQTYVTTNFKTGKVKTQTFIRTTK